MKNCRFIGLLLGVVCAFTMSLDRTPAAGKPVSANRSADVIFFGPGGSPAYKIIGDGAVPDLTFTDSNTLYAGRATINYDLSGDCLFGLRRTTRFLTYDFGDRPPLEDGGPMSVKRIGQIGNNLPAVTNLGAVEFGTPLGQLRFGNVEQPLSGNRDPLGSSSVKIERVGNTWEVSTFRDDCEPDFNPCHVGVLRQTIKGKEINTPYTMPFRLIIREN